VSKQELVGWLQQQIAEQKRIDLSTSGVSISTEGAASNITSKEMVPPSSDVQLVLPGDTKKQRKQVKQLFLDRGEYVSLGSRMEFDLVPSVRDGCSVKERRPVWSSDPRGGRPSIILRCNDALWILDYRRRGMEDCAQHVSSPEYHLCPTDPRGSCQATCGGP
jgi:hypothetical protein